VDLTLPPDISELQRTTRELVDHLLTFEPRFHDTGTVPEEVDQQLRALGYYGIPIPEAYGGTGLGPFASIVVQAELSRMPPQFWPLLRMLIGPGSKTIVKHGTEAQKRRWLPPMATGACAVAFALTEAHAGSDVAGIKTKAVRDGDHWVIDGTKTFITNGHVADLVTVFAYTDKAAGVKRGLSAFLVEPRFPGFKVARMIPTMGTTVAGVTELVFDNCHVPAENLLGEEGQAFSYAMESLNEGRLNVGANAVGIGEMALQQATAYAKQRIAFGHPLGEFQAIQHILADMAVDLHAARLMLIDAAWRLDRGEATAQLCSMVKLFCSEAAGRLADQALQIHGGAGYCKGMVVERLYRDARVLRIYEGASELHRNLIGRQLLR
jgi:acyl-CoA dehydrogenase